MRNDFQRDVHLPPRVPSPALAGCEANSLACQDEGVRQSRNLLKARFQRAHPHPACTARAYTVQPASAGEGNCWGYLIGKCSKTAVILFLISAFWLLTSAPPALADYAWQCTGPAATTVNCSAPSSAP